MHEPFFVSSLNATEEGIKISRNAGVDVINLVDKVKLIISVKGLKS